MKHTAKQYTKQEEEFVRIFYPAYGRVWCSSQLSLDMSIIRNIVFKNKLKRDVYEDLPDIANKLGCSYNEVRSALQSGLKKIKNIIEDEHIELLEMQR